MSGVRDVSFLEGILKRRWWILMVDGGVECLVIRS